MKKVAAMIVAAGLVMTPVPVASAAPYISCPGGVIVYDRDECPPYRTPFSVHPGKGSGGGTGGGGGLLGTLGRIVGGIGGLGGL